MLSLISLIEGYSCPSFSKAPLSMFTVQRREDACCRSLALELRPTVNESLRCHENGTNTSQDLPSASPATW